MDTREQLSQYLRSKLSTVNVLTDWINSSTSFPCVTVWLEKEEERLANEEPWLRTSTLQVDCWSKVGLVEAEGLAEQVAIALADYSIQLNKVDKKNVLEEDKVTYRTQLTLEFINYIGI